MSNTSPAPNLPISSLTIADLEEIVADVVRRVLREEFQRASGQRVGGKPLSQEFLATFGIWEDVKPVDTIIAEIYGSRTVSTREISL